MHIFHMSVTYLHSVENILRKLLQERILQNTH